MKADVLHVHAASMEALIRAGAQADGYPMDDMTAVEVEACMRGPAGSVAVLTVAGPEPSSPHRLVDLERRSLPQPPVQQVVWHSPACLCMPEMRGGS